MLLVSHAEGVSSSKMHNKSEPSPVDMLSHLQNFVLIQVKEDKRLGYLFSKQYKKQSFLLYKFKKKTKVRRI